MAVGDCKIRLPRRYRLGDAIVVGGARCFTGLILITTDLYIPEGWIQGVYDRNLKPRIPGGKLFPPSFRGYQPYSACAVTERIRLCCNTTKTDRHCLYVFTMAMEDGNEYGMEGPLQ